MADLFPITIKPMTQADIDNVIAIEAASYGEHHWSKESFFNELSNELAKYYCAFDNNGNLMGYAGTWQILEEAHLTNIAVSPDFRRRKYDMGKNHVYCRKNLLFLFPERALFTQVQTHMGKKRRR